MVKKASKSMIKESICHQCKEPISEYLYSRSYSWAYEMPGVRWAVCSPLCAQKLKDGPSK